MLDQTASSPAYSRMAVCLDQNDYSHKGRYYRFGICRTKRFVAVHSLMNKATGALLFLLPLTISVLPLKYSAIVMCTAATFAAVQEGHFIRTGRE